MDGPRINKKILCGVDTVNFGALGRYLSFVESNTIVDDFKEAAILNRVKTLDFGRLH